VSRFVPEALVISSGDKWRIRRDFNEQVLDSGRPHRYRDAFAQMVRDELAAREVPRELRWKDFGKLGTAIAQRVILGVDQPRCEMAAQLAPLLRRSNLFVRDRTAFLAFYHGIDRDLEAVNRDGRQHCLLGEAGSLLTDRTATETTQVPAQIGFWLVVLKDAVELHVARTLALIAAHREVQDHVRREVQEAGELTADTIDRLRHLEACLLEQLRLWTPVPLLLRRAVRPFALGGEIPVEAEQQILIHAGFYHRDDRVFRQRANKFSPDEVVREGGGAPDTYFFSAHRQACAGRSLVTFVLKATLASLLRRRRFELIGPKIAADRPIPYLYDHFSVKLRTRPDA
jgi:cytochrome P450